MQEGRSIQCAQVIFLENSTDNPQRSANMPAPAKLIGIARPLPDGNTWVHAVLVDSDGEKVLQRVVDTDRGFTVVGFDRVDCGEEFQELPEFGGKNITVSIGDVPLAGFECADGQILIAPGPELAKRLMNEPLLVGDLAEARRLAAMCGVKDRSPTKAMWRSVTTMTLMVRSWVLRVRNFLKRRCSSAAR